METSAVPYGEPGYFEGYEVTINSVECGRDSIPNAADNPAYLNGDYDAPEFVAATPPNGK